MTISANEPLGTLTVQAVSTVDTTKSKTVTVTIIDNDSNVEVKPDRLPEKWREYTFDEWMNWWETSFANVSEQETEEIYAFFRIDRNFDQLSEEGTDFWLLFMLLTDD